MSEGSPNGAMAFGKGGGATLLLLLATVLRQGGSQIICNIEIDSKQGLWRETTPQQSASNGAEYCVGYTYRETSLSCTATGCPSASEVKDRCNVYYNADTIWPCLATCKEACDHQFKCPKRGFCPCQQSNSRHNRAKMCVPIGAVVNCPSGMVTEQKLCVPISCTNACPNGWCDRAGRCACIDGFNRDVKTGKCVPRACTEACVGGTCHTYGECSCQDGSLAGVRGQYQCATNTDDHNDQDGRNVLTNVNDLCKGITCENGGCEGGECRCYDGFDKDLSNRYKCEKIACPNQGPTNYCQGLCQKTGCTAAGSGWCDERGACQCNYGFKKDLRNQYECARIACPNEDPTNYCQGLCQHTGCTAAGKGWCNEQGACQCFNGFKKSLNTAYQCDQITCPSNTWDVDPYCTTQCAANCKHGTCDQAGHCTCSDGFKKLTGNIYQCDQISCPSNAWNDNAFCKRQCDISCPNGLCDYKGDCTCNEGFEKKSNTLYHCDKISCPSDARDDKPFCQAQCTKSCNGACDQAGACACLKGFKKSQASIYQCDQISCPSYAWNDKAFCQAQCTANCNNGACDQAGACNCSYGFKKSTRNIYQCDQIFCPSDGQDDLVYCASQCHHQCINGTCYKGGVCKCKDGFKKKLNTLYQCDQINCPSSAREDDIYCKSKCDAFCANGKCDVIGNCVCNDGFTKDPNKEYECVKISCPSTPNKPKEGGFCKAVCESQCDKGACDDAGVCTCNDGFKKLRGERYKCFEIFCPPWDADDNEYCVTKCNRTCTNGKCDENGICDCAESFVPTDWAVMADCHHECNEDGSCSLAAILSGIVGVGFAIVVAIVVTAAVMIRMRNQKEQAEKEQGEMQEIALASHPEEPEYANYGQEEEMEENSMYQSFDGHQGRRRAL